MTAYKLIKLHAVLAITVLMLVLTAWSALFSSLAAHKLSAWPWVAPYWAYHYQDLSVSNHNLLILSGILATLPFVAFTHAHLKRQQFEKVHGSARFARPADIKKIGFFAKSGMIIGEYSSRLLRCDIKSHAIVFAPSRSGKGVSQVIPNALSWPGSLLVTDVKLEVFKATSGFRKESGQEVYLFAPSHPDSRSHCYNPLDYVSSDDNQAIADIQLILEFLLPEDASGPDLWLREARSLAVGLLLWLRQSDREFTIGALTDLVKGTDSLADFLSGILEDNELPIPTIALQNISNYLQKAPKEQSGVRSDLISHLNLWDDPKVRSATSKSDFDLRQVRHIPTSIYLGLPINDLKRLAPLMNLFVQQFTQIMGEKIPQDDEPHRVLAILDEFCNLGRLDKVKQGFSFLAGYHVHFLVVIQNIAQGYEIYGQYGMDSFLSNTDYKICYFQNEPTGREFVSKLLGTTTIKSRSQSYQGGMGGAKVRNYTESFIGKPLLTPDEVGQFPKEQAVAIVSGHHPIKFSRIIYYQDNRFISRLLEPITIPALPKASANFTRMKSDKGDIERLASLYDDIDLEGTA